MTLGTSDVAYMMAASMLNYETGSFEESAKDVVALAKEIEKAMKAK